MNSKAPLILILKRQCHEIFDPWFFSLNCTPGSPDSWAKTVLHIDSNSRRSSTKFDDENRLRAMLHSGESRIRANFRILVKKSKTFMSSNIHIKCITT
jgi:hypothetical protein